MTQSNTLNDYDETEEEEDVTLGSEVKAELAKKRTGFWFPKTVDHLCLQRDKKIAMKKDLAKRDPEDRPLRSGDSIDEMVDEE